MSFFGKKYSCFLKYTYLCNAKMMNRVQNVHNFYFGFYAYFYFITSKSEAVYVAK